LLHLVGFLYYFTYIDDARSKTNRQQFIFLYNALQIKIAPHIFHNSELLINMICKTKYLPYYIC